MSFKSDRVLLFVFVCYLSHLCVLLAVKGRGGGTRYGKRVAAQYNYQNDSPLLDSLSEDTRQPEFDRHRLTPLEIWDRTATNDDRLRLQLQEFLERRFN